MEEKKVYNASETHVSLENLQRFKTKNDERYSPKSHGHSNATTGASGFMSNADKTKLDGIATGANNYVHPNDTNTRHVTDAEKTSWNGKLDTSGGNVTGRVRISESLVIDDGFSLRRRKKDNSSDVWLLGSVNDVSYIGESGVQLDFRGNLQFRNSINMDSNQHIFMSGNGVIHTTNNYGIMGKRTDGSNKYMLLMDTSNRIRLGWNKEADIMLDANSVVMNGTPEVSSENAYMYFRDTRSGGSSSRSYVGFGSSVGQQKFQIINVADSGAISLELRGDTRRVESNVPYQCNHNDLVVFQNTRRGVYANSGSIGFTGDSSNWLFYSDNSGNCFATGNVTAFSDAKLKTNLKVIEDPMEKIKQLNGYTYTRKDSGEEQTGVVAQEVEKVLPQAVTKVKSKDSEEETLSVAYGNMVGLLIEGIKELKKEVDFLKEKLSKQEFLQKELV